jgi:hypothetical protein
VEDIQAVNERSPIWLARHIPRKAESQLADWK